MSISEPPIANVPTADRVRLTAFARCAGCAAKLGAGDLSQALRALPLQFDPRLIVGRETLDDAGVFVLTDEIALVQTVDFFAPIVDDPYTFGQIAAANALSDVYAMGGEPLTALNIVGFPAGQLPLEVLTEILRGGQDKVHEAGAIVVGGHTIIDEELKFGVSVTGRAHPKRILSNANAAVGDVLVLTKRLGTGLLATAEKRGMLDAADAATLHASMCALNAAASRAALAVGARCATDVTGFALLGHASHIAAASNVTLRIDAERVPCASRSAGSVGGRRTDRRCGTKCGVPRAPRRLGNRDTRHARTAHGSADVGRTAGRHAADTRGGVCLARATQCRDWRSRVAPTLPDRPGVSAAEFVIA